MTSTTMEITTEALKKVSRELIDNRIINPEEFEKVGAIKISNTGNASNFSAENYIKSNQLYLMEEPDQVNIVFKGTFLKSEVGGIERPQTAFTLRKGEGALGTLELRVSDSRIDFIRDEEVLASLESLFLNNKEIEVTVSLGDVQKITVVTNEATKENGFDRVDVVKSLKGYELAEIGINTRMPSYFWEGTVKLTNFTIFENDIVSYSPGMSNSFNFSEILVSDGTFPLTDASTEVKGYIYKSEINNVQQNNNNIYIKSKLGGDSNIVIRELGLYCNGDDGRKLFAVKKDVAFNKASGLNYEVSLDITINLEVQNPSASPTVVIDKIEGFNNKDFEKVTKLYNNSILELERIVKNNSFGKGRYSEKNIESGETVSSSFGIGDYRVYSKETNKADIELDNKKANSLQDTFQSPAFTSIGHQRDQRYFRECLNQEINLDNCNSVHCLATLLNKLSPKSTYTYDPLKVSLTGNVNVNSETGECRVLTNASCIDLLNVEVTPKRWSLSGRFKPELDTESKQVIAEFCADTTRTPFSLYIESGKLKVSVNQQEKIIVQDDSRNKTYTYLSSNKTETSSSDEQKSKLFSWTLENNRTLIDSSLNVIGLANVSTEGVASGFSSTSYLKDELDIFTLEENLEYTINGKFKADEVQEEQIILDLGTLKVGVANGKAFVKFTDKGGNSNTLVNSEELVALESYYFEVEQSAEGTLSLGISKDGDSYSKDSLELGSSIVIPSNECFVGVSNGLDLPFSGEVDLSEVSISCGQKSWSGSVDMSVIYTETAEITEETEFFSVDLIKLNMLDYRLFVSGNIISKALFDVSPFMIYKFMISFTGVNYTLTYSANGKRVVKDEVIKSSNLIINEINRVILGNTSSLTNKFIGSLFLYDFIIEDENDEEFSAMSEVKNNKELKDFFHITEVPYSLYYVNNLCSTSTDVNYNRIKVFENLLDGEFDNIDFDNNEGFTLSMRVNLENLQGKVILAKEDKKGEVYLKVYLEDSILKCIINQIVYDEYGHRVYDRPVFLQKEIEVSEISEFVEKPILISITYTGDVADPTYRLYKNETLLDSYTSGSMEFLESKNYHLCNYTNEEEMENAKLVVTDIISVQGALTENDLFYISNVLNARS